MRFSSGPKLQVVLNMGHIWRHNIWYCYETAEIKMSDVQTDNYLFTILILYIKSFL